MATYVTKFFFLKKNLLYYIGIRGSIHLASVFFIVFTFDALKNYLLLTKDSKLKTLIPAFHPMQRINLMFSPVGQT